MNNHGGKRVGAGRKPKIEEQELIEKLTPLEDHAFKGLKKAIEKEQSWAIKIFFEYMYGKPRIVAEVNYEAPQPVTILNFNPLCDDPEE